MQATNGSPSIEQVVSVLPRSAKNANVAVPLRLGFGGPDRIETIGATPACADATAKPVKSDASPQTLPAGSLRTVTSTHSLPSKASRRIALVV